MAWQTWVFRVVVSMVVLAVVSEVWKGKREGWEGETREGETREGEAPAEPSAGYPLSAQQELRPPQFVLVHTHSAQRELRPPEPNGWC